MKTDIQYNEIIESARDIFVKKTQDYGSAWRILRPSSLTDQLYIKAKRIRSIEEAGVQKVKDSKDLEYIGLINYAVMALIQMEMSSTDDIHLKTEVVIEYYDKQIATAFDLMKSKNHDYGEAWRDMRTSSLTDLILMKLLRIKQIEENEGETIISEGIDASYLDIINYAVFALIQIKYI